MGSCQEDYAQSQVYSSVVNTSEGEITHRKLYDTSWQTYRPYPAHFEASKAFYTAVLAELKIPMVITDDDYSWADKLVISSVKISRFGGVPTGRHHLAFQATDSESVDAFYRAALNHGGRDNGAPAERTYNPG